MGISKIVENNMCTEDEMQKASKLCSDDSEEVTEDSKPQVSSFKYQKPSKVLSRFLVCVIK